MTLQKNDLTRFSVIFVLFLMTFSSVSIANIQGAPNEQYFFQVRILSRNDEQVDSIALLLAQELRRIRIDSQIISVPSGAFESAVLSREFDLAIIDLEWPNKDPNPSVYFSELGAGNYWSIDSTMIGGQVNEDYLQQAKEAVLDSERTALYYNWQENLMANLVPIIPIYNKITTFITFPELIGWDHQEGIIASLPYMEWTSPHYGQTNTSLFVDYAEDWDVLNPLYVEDDFFVSLVSEPLIRVNKNRQPVGVLAEGWSFNENKTILTINLRENVKWQPDPDKLYINEYFDSVDVIFSILMYQEVSDIGTFYKWVDSIEAVNETAVEIVIDGNSVEPGLQPYAPALYELDKCMLPEHYLNVSVDEYGIPDISSEEWIDYGVNGIGTGMYYLKNYQEGVDAQFNAYEDWWGSTPQGYDEDLDFIEYRIRFMTEQDTKLLEFQKGALDLFRDYKLPYDDLLEPSYQHDSRSEYDVSYIGINMKSDFCPELGDQTLTEDSTMSKGAAVRKAISHMIDKSIIKDMLEVDVDVINGPFSSKFSSYNFHNITSYEPNLDKAKEYMLKAGFDPATITSPGFQIGTVLASLFMISVIIIRPITKNRK
ncbi:MAG: hypothetical protein FK734_17650 [Asgard group archaeon]|nr:hypothetical protein [Asgard group archaeon]